MGKSTTFSRSQSSPLHVDRERSQLEIMSACCGSEDQLNEDEQMLELESCVWQKQRVVPKADTSLIELGDQLAEVKLEEVVVLKDQSEGGDCSNWSCNLPDEVLLQILSFLPLKDAVRTSVLSKRWGHLWASVPDLHFTESDFPNKSVFLGFMGRACALRGGSPIRTLSVSCDTFRPIHSISKLIASFFTCCGVENLFLSLHISRGSYKLPPSIFTCNTLEMLHVESRCILTVPSSASLSNLKVLILWGVILEDKDSVEKLFSCPLLEKLEIWDCKWGNLTKRIHVSAPKLQHLSINNSTCSDNFSYDLQVQINGGCLKSFHYCGGFIDEHCILGDTTHLAEAKLGLYPCYGKDDLFGSHGYKLLSVVSNVKELTLSDALLKELAEREEVPLFSNMIKLTVDTMDSSTVKGLGAILRRSPYLRSLSIEFGFRYCPEIGRDGSLGPVPSCFLTELKEISSRVCPGKHQLEDLYMLCVFFGRAVALEKLTLQFDEKFVDSKALTEDFEEMSNLVATGLRLDFWD